MYKKVKQVPGKADEKAQQRFVAELEHLLKKPDTVVYFTDATHPTHNTEPHYGWIRKGAGKQIAANAGRQRLNLQGAVRIGKKVKAVVEESDTIDSQSTIKRYERLLKCHTNQQIVVICDNARYHHSRLVAAWLSQHQQLKQHFLPAYSPNLNLIERRWKWLKKKVAATVYYPAFDQFKKAVLDLFARLPDYQPALKSLLTLKFQIIHSPLLVKQNAA